MSLRVRFRFDGKCCLHPRYNPEDDGRPKDKTCAGCESLFVIWMYADIARRKAANGEGLARQTEPEIAAQSDVHSQPAPLTSSETTASSSQTSVPSDEGETPVRKREPICPEAREPDESGPSV